MSFVGGGSDLPAFYRAHPGCVLSTTIDKYMYIFIHPFFDQRIQVKYSKTELANAIEEIKHPIVREALRRFDLLGIDINSIADIPAGTGLGSSSSFTVGLLHAIYAYTRTLPSKERLAREACHLEIDILKEPIGKQDQYAAAYGGLNFITFHEDERVEVDPVIMPEGKLRELESSLLMFYVGGVRETGQILSDQSANMRKNTAQFDNVIKMTELARKLRESLSAGHIWDMGPMLGTSWELKKQLSTRISRDKIDHYYDLATKNGALGGKLLGAGGNGFLLFQSRPSEHDKLRSALSELRELKFGFDRIGSKVILVDEFDMD